jgi:hypothetical protein
VVFRHFGNQISAFPLTRIQGSSHENPRSCETRNSVKGRFDNSVFRGSGTREDSVLGSRVLDSRYPKVQNHTGRQIEGRLIAIDPIGDIVSEFGVCGD